MEGGLEDGGYHRMEAGQPEWDQPARMFRKVRALWQRVLGRDSGREANHGQEKEVIDSLGSGTMILRD